MADQPDPGRLASPYLVLPGIAILAVVGLGLIHPDLLGETSLGDFLLVTIGLGGGAAWLTGKAVARGWGTFRRLLVYCVLLTAAVRFAHFALFEDTIFSPRAAVVEFILLTAIATLGYRALRRRQMTQQYGWLYEPAGLLAWRERAR